MPTRPTPLPLIPYPADVRDAAATPISDASRVIASPAAGTEARLLAEAIAVRTGFGVDVVLDASPAAGDIVLTLSGRGDAEAYTVTTGSSVTIASKTPAGLHWGAQTVRQLLIEENGAWSVRGAEIVDAPRFAYRGAMLDVARHFFSVADVCTYIDHLTAYKINVLHLHLSDDQAWRLEIDGYPALTDGVAHYTHDDFRTIVEYAARRHMTVVPEIDVPGHTHAVSAAYPELAEPPVITPEMRDQATALGQSLPVFGEPYAGWNVGFSSVKIDHPETTEFLDEVFTQLASLTPGPWIHFGGDECLGTPADAFISFVERTAAKIAELGKVPICWHEAGAAAGLPGGTIGQYWGFRTPNSRAAEQARRFVAGGGSLILSPADAAYLDMKYDDGTRLGLTWADGPTSLQRANDWDPATVIPGVTEEQVLGVEAPLWTETIESLDDAEEMAFPRLPIIADIAWSPAGADTREWDAVRRRLAAQTAAWKAEGIKFHSSEEIA